MWVIKLKGKDQYLDKDMDLVSKEEAPTYKTQSAATKSLKSHDRPNYPGYLKDKIGYGVKDFETINL